MKREIYAAKMKELTDKEQSVLMTLYQYGGVDGAHHKDWVIDQSARIILGDMYDEFVRRAKAGDEGPDTYEWLEGIAP